MKTLSKQIELKNVTSSNDLQQNYSTSLLYFRCHFLLQSLTPLHSTKLIIILHPYLSHKTISSSSSETNSSSSCFNLHRTKYK